MTEPLKALPINCDDAAMVEYLTSRSMLKVGYPPVELITEEMVYKPYVLQVLWPKQEHSFYGRGIVDLVGDVARGNSLGVALGEDGCPQAFKDLARARKARLPRAWFLRGKSQSHSRKILKEMARRAGL